MKIIKLIIIVLLVSCGIVVLQQCSNGVAGGKYNPEKAPANEQLMMAVLYHQVSAEYRALCYQSFNYARFLVDNDLRRAGLSLKQAIILDIDETVLDNSPYEAQMILKNFYYPEQWTSWVKSAKATAVPGSLDFIQYAAGKGMEIYYVTNRKEVEKDSTISNLKKLNFPYADEKHVFTRKESSSKKDRRDAIATTHRIVMLIGDNLNDFSEIFENKLVNERMELTDSLKDEFGRRFIVIPNAMYGDWESAIYDYNFKLNPEQKKEKMTGYLRGF